MSARVVMYVRQGCHLCDDARAVLAQVCGEAGETWAEVDIDHDAALREQMNDLVPVVEVDGVRAGYWRIRADNVRAALARDGGQ